jgi:hypothetical protein
MRAFATLFITLFLLASQSPASDVYGGSSIVAGTSDIGTVNAAVNDTDTWYVGSTAAGGFWWPGVDSSGSASKGSAFRLGSGLTASTTTVGTGFNQVSTTVISASAPAPAVILPAIVTGVPTRVIGTAFQPSTTKARSVRYEIDVNASSTLVLNQGSGTITMQYADNSAMTTNVVSLGQVTNTFSGLLSFSNNNTAVMTCPGVPAGKWVRISSATAGGGATFSAVRAYEYE